MRSVSASLLAAQRSAAQRPRVSILVRDKQPRPVLQGQQSNPEVQSVACTTYDGAAVIIAALTSGGAVLARRVTSPVGFSPSSATYGWGWYPDAYSTVVAAGGALGWPDGDVAISDSGGTVRIFFIKADGTEVQCVTSTDGGQSWSAAASVQAVDGGTTGYRFCLASGGNNDVWWTVGRAGYKYVYLSTYSGGAWSSPHQVANLMEGGGEYETCYGLAVRWDSSISQYYVIAALDWGSGGDGRLVATYYDPNIGDVHDHQSIVPPGIPMAGHVPWRPALLKTSAALGPLWLVTYWDSFTSGSTSWCAPMVIYSRDFDHWSYKIPLGFSATTDLKAMSVVEVSSSVYIHCLNRAYKLDVYYTGKTDAELTVPHAQVIRYRISERPEAGHLDVEIDNRGGTYDHPGVTGYTAVAMKPLAQVIVKQGLVTSAGEETVEARPMYLWSHSIVRDSGVNLVRLYCVDGWHLLRMWRPDCTIHWESKTLEWCIAEVVSRAGGWRVVTDGSDLWDQELTYVTISAGYDDWSEQWYIRALGRTIAIDEPTVVFGTNMSGLTIVQHLLGLVGGAAKWGHEDDQECLYLWIPAEASDVAVHTYNDGEILALQDVTLFGWPTRVIVTGNGLAYAEVSTDLGMASGMDFLQMIYASQWSTQDELEAIAAGAMADAEARARSGWFRARVNVGLELGDVIGFSDSKAGGGITGVTRRVNEILTQYEPLAHSWWQRVYYEGV